MSSNTMSKSIMIGRVGKKPTFYENGDKLFAAFHIAINREFSADSEKFKETSWFNIVAYNNRAKVIDKYVNEGDLIYIECNIENHTSIDKEGKEYKTDRHVLQTIKFLESKNKSHFNEDSD